MNDRAWMRAGAVAFAAALSFYTPASADEKLLHAFRGVTIAPDGTRVAAIESDEAKIEGGPLRDMLLIRPTNGGSTHGVTLPCAEQPACRAEDLAWSPDSKTLVFTSAGSKPETRGLYAVDANGGGMRRLIDFAGTLGAPKFAQNGQLAVLATAGARKESGATQAGALQVGEIGATSDEQRIAIVDRSKGTLHWASPEDLYVYEYDWKPDGLGFVGTAASGNGDNNWWVAHIYSFDAATGKGTDIYKPSSPQQQLASPRVSPDQKYVAFIGGIMSDFGSTGGDVYTIPIDGGAANDVTPNFTGSATALTWECPGDPDHDHISFTSLDGSKFTIHEVWPLVKNTQHLGYSFDETTASDITTACKSDKINEAFVRQSFEAPPEIYVGSNYANIHALTATNDGAVAATQAQSLTWRSNDFNIQGWLLAPVNPDLTVKHPMVTIIHGGPSAASTPRFVSRGAQREMLRKGYYLFFPNPRGSFGQGETFTKANVKDFGYGDLRDDLAGVDAAEKVAPIDDKRLGITGGSYGGFMTMWAVTQTHRFRAAAAGAGVSNWLSYYGENGIDEWMIPFFGASAYDDPGVYRKSSPIDFIKNVTTPTFEYVGQLDVECPAPQSLEFWHALQTLQVPTQLVIYPGEGHRLRLPAHITDVQKRIVDWFDTYLKV